MLSSEQALSELLMRKEEEWRMLQAQCSQLQEAALQDAQRQLEEAQGKLRCLQEDFIYNLQVLEERDHELERYDAAFAQARAQEEARQAEVSELKIEMAKLKQELTREARRVEELQEQLRLRSQEHRLELDRIHSDKNDEIDHQREQYENLKWRLERKLEELDGELALQRQVKVLNKELEALKAAGAQATECLQRAETANAELEQKLQDRTWELRDLEAVKDARIKDLEDTLHSVQLSRKKEEEMFNRKHEELDRLARERDAVLVAVKGAHVEQLQASDARVQELQAHCENLEVQLRRAEWAQADAAKEKDAIIDRLRDEAAAQKASWDTQVAQMSKEVVSRDLQVQTLREEELKLKAQLVRTQQDVDRYKQQLSQAVERERSLERDQVQLGLDWQRRCDSIERDQIQKSEALIQGLTKARDQVAAKLQETEQALQEQDAVLKAVTLERDKAMEELRTHGLFPRQEPQMPLKQQKEEVSKDFPSREIQRLQEQNTSLRNAITQMRREMETLSNQMPPPAQLVRDTRNGDQPDPGARGDTAPPDCVLALEAEMRDLKHKLKGLEEQLEGVWQPARTSSDPAEPHPKAHSSVEAAGDSICAGQASAGLVLRKLGHRVHLLNLLVVQLKKKVQQQPLELVTVQQELPQEVHQVHLEVLELRQQVAELGKHLGPAWQEGGEPSDRKSLRKEGLEDGVHVGTEYQESLSRHPQRKAQPPKAASVPHLQWKLKEASKKIHNLHLQREQLIEMGNRLRAELGHPKGRPPCHSLPPGPETRDPGDKPTEPWKPLGQLQPHLEAQDLKLPKTEWVPGHERRSQSSPSQPISRIPAPRGSTASPTVGHKQKERRIPTVTCKSSHQKENRAPKPSKVQAAPEKSGHESFGSSSLTSLFLQDTWKLLDLSSSPSSFPSQDESTPESLAPATAHRHPEADRIPIRMPFQESLAIEGMKMAAQSRTRPTRSSTSHSVRPKSCQPRPRIRNYNMKD
ncbi:coiled-coil domain-containing protein 57 isoform X2 [Octodon degus]|uniref:Coiled-coil domain-containing protein 57 isoform X2 n=1 Tax=Octodon degus TaxID=10160 RepID=A0A6P6D5T5_OCTDE|nr:coiled-coil domain-containing protein 57 isoform X2 [Octodon degus]